MANKLKSRRHKKRRVVSSKKRRQPKSRTKSSRTKRYRRKTRKTRGGVKRSVPTTPTQEYNQYNEEPVAPRKNRTRAIDDAVVGVNLFQGFPGNQGNQGNQENINPNQNVAVGTLPQTPMQQGPQTPVFTPIQFEGPPQTPIQQQNLFAQGQETPQGNLNNALDDAYMESITTPQTMGMRRDLNIEPFGYDEDHNEIMDNYEPPIIEDEYYESEEEDDI